jgi:predicted TIM-barrel fold metal-dependent hydrolase
MIGEHAISRRTLLSGLTLAAAGRSRPIMAGVKVIDAHCHLYHRGRSTWREDNRRIIDAADKLGIDQLCCSILPPERSTTLDGFRQCNKWMYEGTQRFPGRVLGYCFVNPGYRREALDEVRRYVEDEGFIGIKLYNDYRCDEPVLWPLVELAIELRVPILQHGGHVSWLSSPQPRISDGSHMAQLARRYPEAMIICAHIAGGGDWEWTVKSLRNSVSVHLDLSGSVIDEGTVEMAVKVLGAERLLFATDLSMTASVGRIRSSDITESERRQILGDNMRRIFSRRGTK